MNWLICGVIGDIVNGGKGEKHFVSVPVNVYHDYDSQLGGANRGRVVKAKESGLYLAFKTCGLF